MDYYGSLRNDYIHKEMYPTEHRVDYFPKGPFTGSSVKIVPKANCVPRFVSKIEGNAVEEGEKVFFEGIVDAQPMPIFSWYFNDEPVEPGRPGWEDAEIHESRKMSTLILTYAREHHMGKYTLVAQNRMGHSVCSCDLIVRKKQFPPVFWQRLYNYEAYAGSKLIAEVEVGGWPIPELVWYKDDEPVKTTLHTENYNGYPNKYVPDRRVEVHQIDPIRHCIIFHRISESDAGLYTVVATNPLGEAVCQAQFVIEPGEGGGADLYIPEKWRTGNRLTWAREDMRAKKFVGVNEPELTDEEIAEMTARVSGVPLPRAIEYLASLPDYYPTPIEGLISTPFKPDVDGASRREGKKGGKPSRPSKFVPGKINHSGFVSDDQGPFLPMWFNEFDPNARDPNLMAYQPLRYDYPEPRPRPERPKSPPCPHVWESHEAIDDLFKLLDTVGCRILLADIRKDIVLNASQAERQTTEHKSYLKKTAEARKQIIHYETKKQDESIKAKQVQKFSYLNPSKSAPKEQVETPRRGHGEKSETASSSSLAHQSHEESQNYGTEYHQEIESRVLPEVPPALPPKTKIMFSPSRHLFSPTDEMDDSSNDYASVQTDEYIPVKEKVKMIAMQQEEIFRKEELKRQTTGHVREVAPPTGGVRILPPSPVTVRRAAFAEEDSRGSVTRVTQAQQRADLDELEEYERLVAEAQREQKQFTKSEQQMSQYLTKSSESQFQSSSTHHEEEEEVIYVTEVSSQQSQTLTKTMTSSAQQATTLSALKTEAVMIPRLEDKYGLESHLEELSSTIDSEESFTSSQIVSGHSTSMTSQSTAAAKSHSISSQSMKGQYVTSTVRSGYSTMSQEEAASSTTTLKQSISSQQSMKTMQDSSYSTASYASSQMRQGVTGVTKSGVTLKDGDDDNEVENISNRLTQQAHQGGKGTEKSSNPDESGWMVRDTFAASRSSPSITASPRVGRKPRVDQSPRRQESESPKYRTPPSTPFQPGFYKKPAEEEPRANPFPLPSPGPRRPRSRKERFQDEMSDSDEENRV